MQSTRWRGMRAALVLAAAIAVGTTQAHETLYLDDGLVYLGEVRDGRPHGEGRMLWPSGAVHVDTWSEGMRHGAGTYRDAEGASYVGTFRDGERDGHGRFTWPDERSYDGAWRAGMRHGQGVEQLPSGLSRCCAWAWGNVVRLSCRPGDGKKFASELRRLARAKRYGTRRCRLTREEVNKGMRCPR